MQQSAAPDVQAGLGGDTSLRRRVSVAVLWWVLPGIVLLAVAAYILAATLGHANPPVVPVQGVSMRPTIQAGDLIFLQGVDPKTLRKGDIVAVTVPPDVQKQYNLPAHIVHRIFKVKHDTINGLTFVTKGDANAGADVFTTYPNDVIGKLRYDVPAAGFPFLFFRSRQGEIFLGAAAILALLYFGLGLMEDRRIIVEGTAATMQNVLVETHELREVVAAAQQLRGTSFEAPAKVNELVEEVRMARAQSDETTKTMRELVGAIGEYGIHLRSHTAVMQDLAATTHELRQAATGLRLATSGASPAEIYPIASPSTPETELPVGFSLGLSPDLIEQRASLLVTKARVDTILDTLSARLASPTLPEV